MFGEVGVVFRLTCRNATVVADIFARSTFRTWDGIIEDIGEMRCNSDI